MPWLRSHKGGNQFARLYSSRGTGGGTGSPTVESVI